MANPWAAIIGGVLGGIGSAINIKRNNKKLAKAYIDQTGRMLKEYNYNLTAIDTQQANAYNATKVDLYNLSLVGSKNIAMVRTALGETGLEGRSHKQVEREVSGVLGMQKASTQENYEDIVNDLRVKRNNLYIQTEQALDSAYKTMKEQHVGTWDAIFFKIPQGVSQGMSLGMGMSGDDSAVYGTQGKQTVQNMYASNSNMNLYSYGTGASNNFQGYSYNMNYGSSGPSAYNFQTGRWG